MYTQRQFSTSISHVSIALFDFRVGCHSGVGGDNRVYPELVNALIEQMLLLNWVNDNWGVNQLGLQGRTTCREVAHCTGWYCTVSPSC